MNRKKSSFKNRITVSDTKKEAHFFELEEKANADTIT